MAANFEVEIIDRETGEVARRIRVCASTKDDAISKVAETGEMVGDAHLMGISKESPVPPPVCANGDKEYQELRANALTAMILSIVGLIVCAPVSIGGAVWAHNINQKVRLMGRPAIDRCTTAITIGWVSAGLWAVVTLVYMTAEE